VSNLRDQRDWWIKSREYWRERAEKAEADLLKALAERDIAKEQHANTLNRLLSERADRARLREKAEAERERLQEALERIANAGRGVPSWRSMSDCARAALAALEEK
jgi:hypothetical protein